MEIKKSKKSIAHNDERQTATSEANTQAFFKTRYTPPVGRAFWDLFKKALLESKNPEDDLNNCIQRLETNEQVITARFESEVTELRNEYKLARTDIQKADAAVKLAHFFLVKQIRLYSDPSKPLADLAMIVAFESNAVAQIQSRVEQLPDEQRSLAFNLLYAMVITLGMGIGQREHKRGKKFTSRETLNEADGDRLNFRKHLPAIAHAFAPSEFEAYVEREFPPIHAQGRGRPPIYEATTDRYIELWKKKHKKRFNPHSLDLEVVKTVMREESAPTTEYPLYKIGIKRELGRLFVESKSEKKKSKKNGTKSK